MASHDEPPIPLEIHAALNPVPVRLSPWRRIVARLFGGRWCCSSCGRRYVPCHSPDVGMARPLPANGWGCPGGHEGYVDWWTCPGVMIRERFDYARDGGGGR
jgi:hypothetical protein